MPLEDNCTRFLGESLFIQPYYGNGWHREELNHPPNDIDTRKGPEAFYVLVENFLKLDDRIIGIRGKVKQNGHQYDGYWCLACLRGVDESNFADKPGQYMIWIARNEPRFSPAAEKAVYEYVTLDKSAPCLCGYGTIAESPNRVQRYVEMAANARTDIKNGENV